MIAARTTRHMTLNGTPYAKGAPISLPKNQFDDLGPNGAALVERVPDKPKAPAKLVS